MDARWDDILLKNFLSIVFSINFSLVISLILDIFRHVKKLVYYHANVANVDLKQGRFF